MKKTMTTMNNEARVFAYRTILEAFEKENNTAVQTDTTSFDFPVIREDGKQLWATVKVTLHKEDYIMEEKAEEFEEIQEERQRKKEEAAEKKRKAAEKKAEREAKKKAKAKDEE